MKNGLLIALCLGVVCLLAPADVEARCCRSGLFVKACESVRCGFHRTIRRAVEIVDTGCCRSVRRERTVTHGCCQGDKCELPADKAPAKAAPKKADVAKPDDKIVDAPAQGDLWAVEVALLERTNEMRARHGLRPLELCRNLLSTAREQSWWMARNRNMSHGRLYTKYGSSENIAMNSSDATGAVNQWMNSSPHRSAMLNASFTRVGVAAYSVGNTTYYTQQFGR